MEVLTGAEGVREAVGRELPPGDWCLVDQARINGFADMTEDHQWIHVDPERAATSPFGGTVAHGFLTLSLLPHLMNSVRRLDGARMGLNYGLNKVRFPSPVPVGSRLRARATITDVTDLPDDGVQIVALITVEIEGGDKPACVAEMVSRSYFDGG